jgi:hypothetical protein
LSRHPETSATETAKNRIHVSRTAFCHYGHCVVAEFSHRPTGGQVALGGEGVVDGGVDGEKLLR